MASVMSVLKAADGRSFGMSKREVPRGKLVSCQSILRVLSEVAAEDKRAYPTKLYQMQPCMLVASRARNAVLACRRGGQCTREPGSACDGRNRTAVLQVVHGDRGERPMAEGDYQRAALLNQAAAVVEEAAAVKSAPWGPLVAADEP
jgi:hypothetical protein